MKTIAISLAPNASLRDAWNAFTLLVQPWRWHEGKTRVALERKFKSFFNAKDVIALTSARQSLVTLLRALDLPQDSEVLLQAFTCVSVPGPVLWARLHPVYVDIDPATYTMDPHKLQERITPKSRVLIIQHTFGIPADMHELLRIAKENNLVVIEDCAHALGSRFHETLVGTFGDASIVSFGRDKAISSTYGGAILLHRADRFPGLARELNKLRPAPSWWILQQLLHPLLISTLIRPLYFVGHLGKLLLVVLQQMRILSKAIMAQEKEGGEPIIPYALLPGALAALALDQFQRLDEFQRTRALAAEIYKKRLASSVQLPSIPENRKSVFLRYPVETERRDAILRTARVFHVLLDKWYEPVAPYDTNLAEIGYLEGSCPHAERAARRILNLPTYPLLSVSDIHRVCDLVLLSVEKNA